jgi:hypothetical protein
LVEHAKEELARLSGHEWPKSWKFEVSHRADET